MRAILTFYQTFASVSITISLFGCYLIWFNQKWEIIVVSFWIKVFSNSVLGVYTHLFRADQYTFYRNLGLRKRSLYGFSFGLDIFIWFALSAITISVMS